MAGAELKNPLPANSLGRAVQEARQREARRPDEVVARVRRLVRVLVNHLSSQARPLSTNLRAGWAGSRWRELARFEGGGGHQRSLSVYRELAAPHVELCVVHAELLERGYPRNAQRSVHRRRLRHGHPCLQPRVRFDPKEHRCYGLSDRLRAHKKVCGTGPPRVSKVDINLRCLVNKSCKDSLSRVLALPSSASSASAAERSVSAGSLGTRESALSLSGRRSGGIIQEQARERLQRASYGGTSGDRRQRGRRRRAEGAARWRTTTWR